MATGKIKWFNNKKGFGFIAPDDGGNDVFVHTTGLNMKEPREEQRVSFDLGRDRQGRTVAENVKAA